MKIPPGRVDALFVCPDKGQPCRRVETVLAIENRGLSEDRHARPGSARQVLLVDRAVLDRLGLRPGDVQENVTVAGLSLHELTPGARLRAGAALLEITAPCEPCRRMDHVRSGLREQIRGRRGMLARVVTGGVIATGDEVEPL